MSRFTKATLFIAGLALAIAAEAALISGLFAERGGVFIGGEWLIPAVAVAAWVFYKEMKKLYKEITEKGETL